MNARRVTLAIGSVLATIVVAGGLMLADPASPVTVSMVDSPDPVASGAQLLYTITVVNTAGSKLTNMLLSDQVNGVAGIGVPPQLQLSSTRGSCNQSGNLVTCNAGVIEGGGTWVVTIRGVVTAASGTVLNDTATVSGTRSAQNFTTTSTTTTLVSGGSGSLADLTIGNAGPTSVVASSPLTYTLTINNTGTANATGVKVVDTLPAGVTGITASGTSLFVCNVAGQTVTCDGGAVNQGSNATVTINGTAPSSIGTITNTAMVDPDNTIPESDELNNTSALVNTQVTSSPTSGLLTIDKTDGSPAIAGNPAWAQAAGPDPVNPGQTLTYKIHVVNTASTRADDVRVVDGTQGLVAATVTASQVIVNGSVGTFGGCTVAAPQVTCSIKSLNAGGTLDVTITGQVITSAGSTIFNTATVTGNVSNKGVTATDSEITTVKPAIDLTITKTDAPDPVCAASWPGPGGVCQGGLTYTFVVGNSGTQLATGVVVRDPLPPGMLYVPSKTTAPNFSGGCSVDAGNVVTCTGGTINPQSITPISINVVVPPTLGPITNTVTVDPNNAIFEADETNNTFTQVTTVGTGIDLAVAKHSNHEANFVATRGTLTYTITVSNPGTQDAANILVRDTLPADTIFRDAVADGPHGFSCSQSGGVVDCIGGHLQGTERMNYPNLAGTLVDVATITVRIFATAYEQPAMHNEVRVDPLNRIAEANELNNLATQDTKVQRGGATSDSFNELTISKVQKSPDPANTARNAVVTYEIKVGNDGTDPVTGVKVRDTLPAGARYIEATGTNSFLCTQQAIGFVDCVGGQIPDHTPTASGATITIKVFAPDTPGTYTNQVEVDPDHAIAEGNEFDNNASAQTVVKNAGAGSFYELSIVKTQTVPLPKTNTARNAAVTYELVVTNRGTDTVNGVVVRDKLPAGSRYIQATGDHQFLCSEVNPGLVDCVNGQVSGTVDNGGSPGTAKITLKMFAPDTPGDYINQANVDPDNRIPEGDELNNQAIETTTVRNGGNGSFNDLTVSFQAAPASSPSTTPGGAITYRLDVTNLGTNDALNVAVRDILPAGVTFVSAADAGPGPGAFTCTQAAGAIDCTGATIAGTVPGPAGTRTIVINVTAPNHVGGLLDQAIADPNNAIPEGDETNNTATFPTSVDSQINLSVTKTGPPSSDQSQTSEYDITVKNTAPGGGPGQTAFGVVMHDPLPVGLIPLSVQFEYSPGPGNWACQIQGDPINLVDCLGDLNPGQSVTVKVSVFMTAESGKPLDNQACVDPDHLIEQFSPPGRSDDCSTHTTIVAGTKRSPNLFVTKNGDPTQVTSGDTLTYVIGVQNNGDADAFTPVTITDVLPSSVTFVDANGTNGWTCSGTTTVSCHDNGSGLTVGASATITIHTTVNSGITAPIVNTATAAPATHNPGESDAEDETFAHQGDNAATTKSSTGGSAFDLVLSSITDNPDPVTPGQGLKYTIIAVNGGSAAANGVHLSVTLPSATSATFLSADGSNGFNCSGPVANVLDCVGDLPAGGDTTVTVSMIVIVQPMPAPDLVLSAEIDSTHAFAESDEGNNSKTEITTISGLTCSSCIDLVAAQLVTSAEPLSAGGSETFTFQVVNVGDTSTATNPLTDTLIEFDYAAVVSLTPGIPVSSNPAITCTVAPSGSPVNAAVVKCVGNLGPGQGVTITVPVTNVIGDLFAAGTADPGSKVAESNEGNNSLFQSVVVF
jgi:uncharacterized repeat protein (TIGR01451 family)